MNANRIHTYILSILLIISLSSCGNSGSGGGTGSQNATAAVATDSNIGVLPSGSVVYSSSAKYTVPADKTTSGILSLSDDKNEAGVFKFSIMRTDNKQDISKLPKVSVVSNPQQSSEDQSNFSSSNIYGLEINANNATPGKYIMAPEFVSNNGSKTKLNYLVLEVTSSAQNKSSLKVATTNSNATTANSAFASGNLAISFTYQKNRRIPYATITLTNSYDVHDLQVNVSVGRGNDISYRTCHLSSGRATNSCRVMAPEQMILAQGILNASAVGYATVSKHFLRDGYLTLQVNHFILANSQKNIVTVTLKNSQHVDWLPVEVSLEGAASGGLGLSNNICALSTANNECQVDLSEYGASNDPQIIKAFVRRSDASEVYVPATDAISIAPTILAGTNNGFTYLNGAMITRNGSEGTVDGSSIKLVNIDKNGHIYAGTANGYVYNSPNTSLNNSVPANGWQQYNNTQFKVIAMDNSGNIGGVTATNHIYVQNGGDLFSHHHCDYHGECSGRDDVYAESYYFSFNNSSSYTYDALMAFWDNTPYSTLNGVVFGFGTNISGHPYNQIDNYGLLFSAGEYQNMYNGSISYCVPLNSGAISTMTMNSGDRIYVGGVSGGVAYCSIGVYASNNAALQYNQITVHGLTGNFHNFGYVPDKASINSLIVDNGTIYAATAGGHVYYYNEASSSAWAMLGGGAAPNNAIITSIAISGGKVFASAGDGIYLVSDNSWEEMFSTKGDQVNGIATVPSL